MNCTGKSKFSLLNPKMDVKGIIPALILPPPPFFKGGNGGISANTFFKRELQKNMAKFCFYPATRNKQRATHFSGWVEFSR
jgi:hypothetical protein